MRLLKKHFHSWSFAPFFVNRSKGERSKSCGKIAKLNNSIKQPKNNIDRMTKTWDDDRVGSLSLFRFCYVIKSFDSGFSCADFRLRYQNAADGFDKWEEWQFRLLNLQTCEDELSGCKLVSFTNIYVGRRENVVSLTRTPKSMFKSTEEK